MNDRTKRIVSNIRKYWMQIWLISVAVALSVIIVSADFLNSSTNMKRVVVATAQNGKMFSSDWLYENGISTNISRRQHFAQLSAADIESGKTYDVPVHIFNFDINNPQKHYSNKITYDLTAKMVYADGSDVPSSIMGNKKVIIEYGDDGTLQLDKDNLSDTTTITGEELVAKTSATETSQNTYLIKFSSNWNLDTDSNIYVQLEAIRTGDSADYKDISDLGGKIGITKSDSGSASGWNGELTEKGTPSSYDGYNFVLTGSGSARIIIEWDTSKISVNKYFYDETLRNIAFTDGEVTYTPPSNTGDYGTWAKLTILADSSVLRTGNKYRNRYEFQLYKTSMEEPPSDFASITTSGTASKTGKWIACTISNTNS